MGELPAESNNIYKVHRDAFTIVELLIVIVVIAILAAISIVTYNGIQARARASEASAGLAHAKKKLELYRVDNSNYPTTGNLSSAGITDKDISYQYTSDGSTYCITGTSGDVAYRATNTSTPSEGVCSGHAAPSSGSGGGAIANGDPIQTVTSANCPSARTMTVDARDNRTYWVQKLADGRCWMLTNLAYAGGGTNTYSDTVSISNGESGSITYTEAKYYVPTSANPTTAPTQPSTSTDGTGQYGYLYNWCAAMGAQTNTNACTSTTIPVSNTSISICPSGWRLPTGGSGGEFTALNNAINSGSTGSDAGLIASPWLAQHGGQWYNGFSYQSVRGYYWSSSEQSSSLAYELFLRSDLSNPSHYYVKRVGYAVRCVAS